MFDAEEKVSKVPSGHACVDVQMIFDIKMENCKFEARLVANDDETESQTNLTHVLFVSMESTKLPQCSRP